jgi:hypothetical protein
MSAESIHNTGESFAFRVGIVGHRTLAPEIAQAARAQTESLLRALAKLLNPPGSVHEIPIVLMSPLAEGADRIFVEAGQAVFGYRLRIVATLPKTLDRYEQDFPETVDAFRSLIARCEQVIVSPLANNPNASDEERYANAADLMLTQCNLIISVWDGVAGRAGGTHDAVRHRFEEPQRFGTPDAANRSGPQVVLAVPNKNESQPLDAIFSEMVRTKSVVTLAQATTTADPLTEHRGWLAEYARVAHEVRAEQGSAAQGYADASSLFVAADTVAGKNQRRVTRRATVMSLAFALASTLCIFAGTLFPKFPANYLGPVLIIVFVLAWSALRKHTRYRLYRTARLYAEGMRVQSAIDEMKVPVRAFDLLPNRRGELATSFRELLRSSAPSVRADSRGPLSRLESCAGWAPDQLAYYAQAHDTRKERLKRREFIRKYGLIGGGTVLVFANTIVGLLASQSGMVFPKLLQPILQASALSAIAAGVLLGNYTQQLQLREQVESFATMNDLLKHYSAWSQSTASAPYLTSEHERLRVALRLMSRALEEQETWAHRQSGASG